MVAACAAHAHGSFGALSAVGVCRALENDCSVAVVQVHLVAFAVHSVFAAVNVALFSVHPRIAGALWCGWIAT